MNPTDCRLRINFSDGSLRPKRRCRPAEVTAIAATVPLTIPSFQRMPRIQRRGRPHPQVWVRPVTVERTTESKSPAAPNIEEKVSPVRKITSSSASFLILRRYNTHSVDYIKAKALQIFNTSIVQRYSGQLAGYRAKAVEIFYKYEPRLLVTLKRIGAFSLTMVSTMAALRAHDSAKL